MNNHQTVEAISKALETGTLSEEEVLEFIENWSKITQADGKKLDNLIENA